MKWLTPELAKEIRDIFESKYRRKLSNKEVEEIAESLSNLCEIYLKFKHKEKQKKSNTDFFIERYARLLISQTEDK